MPNLRRGSARFSMPPTAAPPSISITCPPRVRRRRRARRPRSRDRRRRVRRAARAVGVRQDDRPEDPRRVRAPRRGRVVVNGQDITRLAPRQAQHGHGVPGLQPVPQPQPHRQRRLRTADARPRGPGDRRKRAQELLELVGLEQAVDRYPQPALRRPATAGRTGPRARDRAQCAAARRAAVRARRAGARPAAGRDPPAAAGTRASRRCSSPTISPRRSRWPTGSA